MNKYSVMAGVIASVAICISGPAVAHGGAGWSVTIESGPQPYYYSPPPTFYPQSPYPYGPPPSAFAPPPPSPPVYRYEYQERWSGQQYHNPHGHRDHSWRDRQWRERERNDQHSRDRWQNNNRPGPGANHDLQKWGYGDRRR